MVTRAAVAAFFTAMLCSGKKDFGHMFTGNTVVNLTTAVFEYVIPAVCIYQFYAVVKTVCCNPAILSAMLYCLIL